VKNPLCLRLESALSVHKHQNSKAGKGNRSDEDRISVVEAIAKELGLTISVQSSRKGTKETLSNKPAGDACTPRSVICSFPVKNFLTEVHSTLNSYVSVLMGHDPNNRSDFTQIFRDLFDPKRGKHAWGMGKIHAFVCDVMAESSSSAETFEAEMRRKYDLVEDTHFHHLLHWFVNTLPVELVTSVSWRFQDFSVECLVLYEFAKTVYTTPLPLDVTFDKRAAIGRVACALRNSNGFSTEKHIKDIRFLADFFLICRNEDASLSRFGLSGKKVLVLRALKDYLENNLAAGFLKKYRPFFRFLVNDIENPLPSISFPKTKIAQEASVLPDALVVAGCEAYVLDLYETFSLSQFPDFPKLSAKSPDYRNQVLQTLLSSECIFDDVKRYSGNTPEYELVAFVKELISVLPFPVRLLVFSRMDRWYVGTELQTRPWRDVYHFGRMFRDLAIDTETVDLIIRCSRVQMSNPKRSEWANRIKTPPPEMFQIWQLGMSCLEECFPLTKIQERYQCTRSEVIRITEILKAFMHPKEVQRFSNLFNYDRHMGDKPGKFSRFPKEC
jgi:hypothetical protein